MTIREGSVSVQGPVAVVPQQAWIFNGTVKSNIIFGLEFDQEKVDLYFQHS
jgi:ABC-type multidrug transport system fused ATPase/permease subunit